MAFERDEELRCTADRPTLPYDLREYAQLHTGPDSWTAERVAEVVSLETPPPPADLLAELDDPLDPEPALRSSDIPHVAITVDEVREHALDHREGYVLSLVDGLSSVSALCDITGLPREETMRVLSELCDRGVISTDDEQTPSGPWQILVQRYAI